MDLEVALTLLGVLVAALSIGVGTNMLIYRFKTDRAAVQPLETLLAKLSETTSEAQKLAREANARLSVEVAQVEKLKREASAARESASISQEGANAISKQLEGLLATHNRKATKANALMSGLFFIGGAAITLAVTLFVRPLWG